MKFLARVAFVLSLVAAASATGDASQKKSTLTYTATTTKSITPSTTLTGDFTGITYSTTYTGSTVSGYATSVTGTNTYTYTQTHTSYTRPKAAKTVSVPTSKGFTPLLSESVYTDAISIVRLTETATLPTSTRYLGSPTAYFTKTEFATPTAIIGTTKVQTQVFTVSITTSTSTLPAVATETVYAACAPNNIIYQIPTGQNLTGERLEYTKDNTTSGVYDTPEDCCAACMAAGGCAGGLFAINGGTPTCTAYYLDPGNATQVCDGSKDYSTFSYGAYDSAIEGRAIFNGPCGGFQWAFDSRPYFQ